MDSPSDSAPAFAAELVAIMEDARVRGLALRHAGPGLAEEALNEAYYRVARVPEPTRIMNLRAYFCKVLINETAHLRAQSRAIPAGDLTDMSYLWQAPASSSDDLENAVQLDMFSKALFARLETHREELLAAIPGRSSGPDGYQAATPARSHGPDRYRAVILSAAEHLLREALRGEAGESDSNDAFRAAYPEYFDQPGATSNILHQRLSRARGDVRKLLQAIVSRDELS